MAHHRVPKGEFHPVKHPGKLHHELHIPEGEKIPQSRLQSAMHSSNREVRNDAIRAHTMEGWHHPHGHPGHRGHPFGGTHRH